MLQRGQKTENDNIYDEIRPNGGKGHRRRRLMPGQQTTRKMTEDEIPRVKGCATMWHETTDEMAVMLKSIFRMDLDYSAR